MNANSFIGAPSLLPCVDCGEDNRRLRVVNCSGGPSLSFSMRAPLYCRQCAPARLDAAQARHAARCRRRQAAGQARHAAWADKAIPPRLRCQGREVIKGLDTKWTGDGVVASFAPVVYIVRRPLPANPVHSVYRDHKIAADKAATILGAWVDTVEVDTRQSDPLD